MQRFNLEYIILMPMLKNYLPEDEVQRYATAEERIVDMQGEALKVLKAFEVVIGHLRKFLVDRSVLPQFEKTVSSLLILLISN